MPVKAIRRLFPLRLAFSVFLALMLAGAVLGQNIVVHVRVVGVTDGDALKILVGDQELWTWPIHRTLLNMRTGAGSGITFDQNSNAVRGQAGSVRGF